MFNTVREAAKNLFSFFLAVFFGLLFAFVLREHVFFNAVVPSESMYPSIDVGDLLIGSRLAYVQDAPQRGDIITFENLDVFEDVCLKRIIGLPGETLEIINGKVYINSRAEPLAEPYLGSDTVPIGDFGPYEIPEDCYFVMGDNRNVSYDSRYWDNHFISIDNISSKIVFKYYPKFEIIE